MSRKEQERLVVFGQVKVRQLSQAEGAEVLGLSLRQVHQLYVRWCDEGDRGLSHRARGRASPRRRSASERDLAWPPGRSDLEQLRGCSTSRESTSDCAHCDQDCCDERRRFQAGLRQDLRQVWLVLGYELRAPLDQAHQHLEARRLNDDDDDDDDDDAGPRMTGR